MDVSRSSPRRQLLTCVCSARFCRLFQGREDECTGSSSAHNGFVGIVGGEPARIEDYPYLVSLWKRGKFHCGGTIINDRFVLTSGRCVILLDTSRYYVLAGTADIETQEGGQRHNLEQIIRHDHFNDQGQNDICLLKLTTSLVFSSRVSEAHLPEYDVTLPRNTVFNVAGWGSETTDGEISTVLRSTRVPLFNKKTCKEIYNRATVVNSKMICAGTIGQDACRGDSGGPLILEGVVVGIVSRGASCGSGEYPTIYTKVSAYLNWIRDNMRN
ncbi:Trypsin-6 [Eumeta japonica]|uniref:limulus clotting factor C n=1 Tax=Eumeta variegata TaxID=151549 RepID=A0A4C1SWY6_EUMVA|nr:Trypsin-6 [Eumeta japonica]